MKYKCKKIISQIERNIKVKVGNAFTVNCTSEHFNTIYVNVKFVDNISHNKHSEHPYRIIEYKFNLDELPYNWSADWFDEDYFFIVDVICEFIMCDYYEFCSEIQRARLIDNFDDYVIEPIIKARTKHVDFN